MGSRTIPEPNDHDLHEARTAKRNLFLRHGLNPDSEPFRSLIEDDVMVDSQQKAEIRWLRNLLHTGSVEHGGTV